jgi:hypothetical protein
MSGSSILVVANALRLRGVRKAGMPTGHGSTSLAVAAAGNR